MSNKRNDLLVGGFSLVELSIVLVILGLLVGGILGGQSLIKAAETRSITVEYQQWQTVVNNFKIKYFTLPGDMKIATQFWDSATWNGNGDGQITTGENSSQDAELFLFWQHMALAGLITGDYTGLAGPLNTFHVIPGENAPVARYPSAGWTATTREGGSGARYNYTYKNAYLFGAATTSSLPQNPLLPPEVAWNVDTKFDDGKPGRGNIIALYYTGCANASGNQDYDTPYALNDTSVQCALYFRNGM